MGLTYCESCQQFEGDTVSADVSESGETECADCGEPVKNIPEHDDYDLER